MLTKTKLISSCHHFKVAFCLTLLFLISFCLFNSSTVSAAPIIKSMDHQVPANLFTWNVMELDYRQESFTMGGYIEAIGTSTTYDLSFTIKDGVR